MYDAVRNGGLLHWTPVAVVAAAVTVEPTILDTFLVGSATRSAGVSDETLTTAVAGGAL